MLPKTDARMFERKQLARWPYAGMASDIFCKQDCQRPRNQQRKNEVILALLHLSDIHFCNRGNSKILVEELKLQPHSNRRTLIIDSVCVGCGGDVAFSGNKEQYENCFQFLVSTER